MWCYFLSLAVQLIFVKENNKINTTFSVEKKTTASLFFKNENKTTKIYPASRRCTAVILTTCTINIDGAVIKLETNVFS